ncbi:MAG TPA: biotin carboxylase N-terminal domain-containing protein [Acidimicrobiales bacterium]|nr:biotin carboxylase N-terminal domain-containing protein [Acidimicrobiales bacterium]
MSFDTLLIANRGEIARRVARAGREMGLRVIGVYVEADANEPFIADCDEAVLLETSYLDGAAIVAAARASGAQAIHPGYGFLSENALFATMVEEAGLTWVGPPARVIRAMGDKIAAKALAREAGVAVLLSSDDPTAADQVGYPLLIKAAAGGGGKGMRVVTRREDFDDALAAAQREAASAFGDDRVFVERYVAASRHVEIQIVGDHFGNLIHLGERECSIQRRHQKLVEESPSSALTAPMRAAMGEAALNLARAINYHSVGTVEFLVDDETREFFFLEVNTRLQVEHPVTEEVTGVDLVRTQLRIAAGEPLDMDQDDVVSRGHAIEVRLCAEDPANGFLPATGTIAAFEPALYPPVRVESGVEVGSRVSVSFDPLLAKIIAVAPTRVEAATTLARALEGLHLGGVTTNRDFLAATLRHEGFLTGDTTTDFIARYEPARELVLDEDETAFATTAAALWLEERNRANAPVLAFVPSGWRNARLPRERVTLRRQGDHVVTYRRRRDGAFDVDAGLARVRSWSDRAIDLEFNGRRANVRVTADGDHLHVQVRRGTATFQVVPRFVVPGSEEIHGGLIAPMPGVVLAVRAEIGQRVRAGDTLVVLEAMKMEHVITAPHDCVVTDVFVAPSQQVDRGTTLLAVSEADG